MAEMVFIKPDGFEHAHWYILRGKKYSVCTFGHPEGKYYQHVTNRVGEELSSDGFLSHAVGKCLTFDGPLSAQASAITRLAWWERRDGH